MKDAPRLVSCRPGKCGIRLGLAQIKQNLIGWNVKRLHWVGVLFEQRPVNCNLRQVRCKILPAQSSRMHTGWGSTPINTADQAHTSFKMVSRLTPYLMKE